MHGGFSHNPALTIALALTAGMVAQILARHLRIPGIVLLLTAGVMLGPDVLGLLEPEVLGRALTDLTGFAVAVILFEGGLGLRINRMRSQRLPIRLLLTLGVLITSVGGALAVKLVLGWDWLPSILFGTLVIVTGPTVVTPLLRRIRAKRSLETILETEGVLIDAVGAVVAVVALEIALAPGGSAAAHELAGAPLSLLGGLVFGLAGGWVITALLNRPALVPEGLVNVLVLSLLLALYQVSNALLAESGITAAIAAGFVTGNRRSEASRELREFKEQLTTMLLGLLFVLLAADVRVAEVMALGAPGLAVAGLLMFVVRPVNVLACTVRSNLTWRDKAFLSWVAPRGIVAAVVATLFQERLTAAGYAGGDLRALVFLVIAATVVFQGATAELMARLLGVRRPSGDGYAVLGANPLALQVAAALRDLGTPPVLVDGDAERCKLAEALGFRVLFGNALEERIWLHAAMDSRRGVVALELDEAYNQLFAQRLRREMRSVRVLVAVQSGNGGVEPNMVREIGAMVLFADEVDLELWNVRARRDVAVRERWRRVGGEGIDKSVYQTALPLAAVRHGLGRPVHDGTRIPEGAEVIWLLVDETGRTRLRESGWEPVPAVAQKLASEGTTP